MPDQHPLHPDTWTDDEWLNVMAHHDPTAPITSALDTVARLRQPDQPDTIDPDTITQRLHDTGSETVHDRVGIDEYRNGRCPLCLYPLIDGRCPNGSMPDR